MTLLHELQEDKGLKCGNRMSNGHIEFQRQNMSIKVAAQTLSSSVADAIQYLIHGGQKGFDHAEGTVMFTRISDRVLV